IKGTKRREDQQYSRCETPVSNAVDDEGFLGRVSGALLQEVIANQQILTQTNTLPSNEHHHEVVPKDEREHPKHEQVQIGKESIKPILFPHVSVGINMDKEADSRH